MRRVVTVLVAVLLLAACERSGEKQARVTLRLTGGLQADAPIAAPGDIPVVPAALPRTADEERPRFPDLDLASGYTLAVEIPDFAGKLHTVHFYFFHTGDTQFEARSYLSHETGEEQPVPVLLTDAAGRGSIEMQFNGGKERSNKPASGKADIRLSVAWPGADQTDTIDVHLDQTQFDSVSNLEPSLDVMK